MLNRFLWIVLGIPVAVAMVAIAIANTQSVRLVLDPFRPQAPALTTPPIPLYGLLLGALILGVVLGGVATWLTQGRWRRTARAKSQDAMRWQAEADRLTRERDQHVEGQKRLASR